MCPTLPISVPLLKHVFLFSCKASYRSYSYTVLTPTFSSAVAYCCNTLTTFLKKTPHLLCLSLQLQIGFARHGFRQLVLGKCLLSRRGEGGTFCCLRAQSSAARHVHRDTASSLHSAQAQLGRSLPAIRREVHACHKKQRHWRTRRYLCCTYIVIRKKKTA